MLIFALTIIFFVQNAAGSEGPIVETKVGLIRGVPATDGNYTMFMGIPYAKVNESNVFGDAVPYPNFNGIFEANDDSAICPQVEEYNFTVTGTLDCLHINIYVPDRLATNQRLPVLVNIYGGGFSIGFAGRYNHGPKYIVRHDVILVSFNYRLGPYGFMCLNTPDVPGNQGLRDQVRALRWIRENIESFGGDPERITLFGNSAGAISIELHLMSPQEKLFKNIILQSGSALFNNMVGTPRPESIFRLSEILGFPTSNMNEAISFISSLNSDDVILASSVSGLSFGPCLESEFSGIDNIILDFPINVKITKHEGTNVMIGHNTDESLSFFASVSTEMWVNALSNAFVSMLNSNFDFEESQLHKLASLVRQFYIGDEELGEEVRSAMMAFQEDSSFVYSAYRSVGNLLQNDIQKVYFYVFAYDGRRNFVKVKNNINEPGVTHADEVGYLFDMAILSETPTPEDQLIIDRMTTMWTNFVKYDDPTPGTTQLLPVKWEAVTKNSPYHYLEIDTVLKAGARYQQARMSFWDLFYEAYGENERVRQSIKTNNAAVFTISPMLISLLVLLSGLNASFDIY